MIYGNVYADGRSQNSLFELDDPVHRHNPTFIPRMLREALLAYGIEINTPDLSRCNPVAFDLHLEGRPFADDGTPKYLIALENPYHNRLNEDREYCRRFRKVFTWDKRLYDLPNVVPVMVPQRLEFESFSSFEQRDIFCCMINANKAFRHSPPADLYAERLKTIRWYEKHAPDKFELYGMGWEKPTPAFDMPGKLRRSLASLRSKLFGYMPFPSYRGEVSDKAIVMRRCKFAFCYENTRGPDNYITEKIFDSFLSGCVPVYWGADNILEHIPAACFIDRRDFPDTAAVHQKLLSITPDEHARYQSNIYHFLTSDSSELFDVNCFIATIAGQISRDIKGRLNS